MEWASGRLGGVLAGVDPAALGCPWLLGDYRIVAVGIVALAYLMAARVHLAARTGRTFDQLEPLLEEGSVAEASALPASGWLPHLAALAGVALTGTMAYDISDRPVELTRAYWIGPHVWEWAWFLPFGWSGGRFLYEVGADSIATSRLARRLRRIDLLEMDWVQPFVNQGLRSALLVVVFIGILSIHFLDAGTGPVTAALLAGLLAIGAGVSILPGFGVRRRIRDDKRESLAQVRSEIREHSGRALGQERATSGGVLPDLLAMESRLEAVPEWPFMVSSAARLVIYSLLGLGSWLGGLTVEWLVERALG